MTRKQATLIADEVIDLFYGRNGFDHWWEQLDSDMKDEIREDLIDRILES